MIKKLLPLILLFPYFSVLPQTGQPIPAPHVQIVNYSESVPYQLRVFPPPADSKSKKKKEKAGNKENMESKAPVPTEAPKQPTESDLPLASNELVIIPVSVFDPQGKLMLDLKASDFKVFAGGEEQEIISVENQPAPVNLILLIDSSPSASLQIEEIQEYALNILKRLGPEDKVMVVEFNEKVNVLCELTADRKAAVEAIKKTKFGDGTSLYTAVRTVFRKYAGNISGRKAVILLTDGVDTTSVKDTYQNSLVEAERANVVVFPVYFDTSDDSGTQMVNGRRPATSGVYSDILNGILFSNSSGRNIDRKAEYALGRMYLDDLANLSGGRPLKIKKKDDFALKNIEYIGPELKLQYQIKIRPANFHVNWRKPIVVRVNRPGFYVQARGSLIGSSVEAPKP